MINYTPIPILFTIGETKIYSLYLVTITAVLVSCFLIIKELRNLKKGKKTKKPSLIRIADLSSPYIALSLAIFWIGAFLSWNWNGKPANLQFAVWVDNVPYHPTQIYLAIGSLLICLVLLSLRKKVNFGRQNGNITLLLLLLYSALNFIVEFFRFYLQRDFLMGLTISQWISMLLIFVSLCALIVKNTV